MVENCLTAFYSVQTYLGREGYRSISVPDQIHHELERFVADYKGGYVSVAEVVREAVRDFERKRPKSPRLAYGTGAPRSAVATLFLFEIAMA